MIKPMGFHNDLGGSSESCGNAGTAITSLRLRRKYSSDTSKAWC